MFLSLKKSIFLFLFAFFQVLLFLFLSTTYQLIIISLFLVFLLFYFWFFKLEIYVDRKIWLLWIIFMLSLVISTVFTHSIPLSIDSLIFHISSFSIFIFFRSLGKSRIFSKFELVSVFLLVGLVFSSFFIVFFSFSDLAKFLPPVNMFTTKYGHSHFAALLLFLIPLGWWFSFSDKYNFFHSKKSVLFLFYVLLIFTFGRFAILLNLLQLPVIYILLRRKKIKKILLYAAGFSLLLSLIVIGIFSTNYSENCKVHEFRSQICKPILGDSRLFYFKQAITGLKFYPLFGYGPGTFSLIDKKYNPIVQRSSIYTHNAFLQMFAESGLFSGFLYIFLVFYLFKNMFYVLRKNREATKFNALINNFLFLGLINLMLNSLVDFDWNIFSIYQMTVMFIAIVLWDYPISKETKIRISTKSLKFFWIFISSIVIFLGLVNISTKLLISFYKDNIAFTIFPYFYSQSTYFLEESEITDKQKQFLYKIYKNHSKFVLDNIDKLVDLEKKKELYGTLSKIKSLSITDIDYYKVLEELGDYETLGEVSQKGLYLLNTIDNNDFPRAYEDKSEIMIFLHKAAIELINDDKPNLAVDYYDAILNALYNVDDKNKEYHHFYRIFLSESSPWRNYLSNFLRSLYKKDLNLARKELLRINEIHTLSIENNHQDDVFMDYDLSNIALDIAYDDLVNGNFIEAARMCKLAQKFNGWAFNNIHSDFLYYLGKATKEERMAFWLEMDDFPGEYFGKHTENVVESYFISLGDALEVEDEQSIDKISKKIIEIFPWIVNDPGFKSMLK